MNDDDIDDTDTLDALATQLDSLDGVLAAAAHHDWLELVVEGTQLGPTVLRDIADHDAAVTGVMQQGQGFRVASIERRDSDRHR